MGLERLTLLAQSTELPLVAPHRNYSHHRDEHQNLSPKGSYMCVNSYSIVGAHYEQ